MSRPKLPGNPRKHSSIRLSDEGWQNCSKLAEKLDRSLSYVVAKAAELVTLKQLTNSKKPKNSVKKIS